MPQNIMTMNKGKWILKCVVGGIVFLLAIGGLTMLLWNWLVPSLFNGPELRFVEALGLLLLSKILFGGWGRGGWKGRGASWKQRYHEKLAAMPPEARERFKARMQEKWRCAAPARPTPKADGSND